MLRVSPDPLETVDLLETPRGRHRHPAADRRRDLGARRRRRRHGDGRLGGHVRAPRPAVRRIALGRLRRPAVREAFLLVVPRQQILDDLIDPAATGCRAARFVRPASGRGRLRRRRSPRTAPASTRAPTSPRPPTCSTRPASSSPRVCILYDPANPRRVAEFTLIRTSAARAGLRRHRLLERRLGGPARRRRHLRRRAVRVGHHAARAGRGERGLRERLEARELQPVLQPRGRPPDRRGGRVRRRRRGHASAHRDRRARCGRTRTACRCSPTRR